MERVWWLKSPEEGSASYLDSTISFDVDLDIMEGLVLFTPLEGGPTKAMLLVVAVRSSAVGEDHHYLVNRLRVRGKKILPIKLNF